MQFSRWLASLFAGIPAKSTRFKIVRDSTMTGLKTVSERSQPQAAGKASTGWRQTQNASIHNMSCELTEKQENERIAAWGKIQTLPTIESQAFEWFCYLCSYGHQLPAPYTEYFNGVRANATLQLYSGFWQYNRKPYWGLKLSDVYLPPEKSPDRWLAHTLELLFHSMPHQVLVIEKLGPMFPSGYLSSAYWPYVDGWLFRFRGNCMVRGEFHPHAFKPMTREDCQEIGIQTRIPDHYAAQRRSSFIPAALNPGGQPVPQDGPNVQG